MRIIEFGERLGRPDRREFGHGAGQQGLGIDRAGMGRRAFGGVGRDGHKGGKRHGAGGGNEAAENDGCRHGTNLPHTAWPGQDPRSDRARPAV